MDDRLLTILQTAHQFNLTTGLLYTAIARGELATIRLPPRGRIRVRETDVRGWTDGHPSGARLDRPRLMRPLDRPSPRASGIEAFDLLQALNAGHAGTLSTIHANGAEMALRRFTWCALQSGVDVPYPAIRYGLAECLQVLVHLERRGESLPGDRPGARRNNPGTDTYDLESL